MAASGQEIIEVPGISHDEFNAQMELETGVSSGSGVGEIYLTDTPQAALAAPGKALGDEAVLSAGFSASS